PDTASSEVHPLSLHDALPIYVHHLRRLIGDAGGRVLVTRAPGYQVVPAPGELDADRFAALVGEGRQALASGVPALAVDLLDEARSEEHTSELQSRRDLVCRLL